jgi:hypothetical protein
MLWWLSKAPFGWPVVPWNRSECERRPVLPVCAECFQQLPFSLAFILLGKFKPLMSLCPFVVVNRSNLVDEETECRLMMFELPAVTWIVLPATTSTPALRPTQLPIQLLLTAPSWRVRRQKRDADYKFSSSVEFYSAWISSPLGLRILFLRNKCIFSVAFYCVLRKLESKKPGLTVWLDSL